MADNYLEKRYSQVFKKASYVDPETGYEVSRAVVRRFPAPKPSNDSENKKKDDE